MSSTSHVAGEDFNHRIQKLLRSEGALSSLDSR